MKCSCGEEMIRVEYDAGDYWSGQIVKYPKMSGKAPDYIGHLVYCPVCGIVKVEKNDSKS